MKQKGSLTSCPGQCRAALAAAGHSRNHESSHDNHPFSLDHSAFNPVSDDLPRLGLYHAEYPLVKIPDIFESPHHVVVTECYAGILLHHPVPKPRMPVSEGAEFCRRHKAGIQLAPQPLVVLIERDAV